MIFAKLPDDPARRRFITAQTASWLAFRNADCTSVADVNEGGTLAGINYLSCVAQRDSQRLTQLGSFENALSHSG